MCAESRRKTHTIGSKWLSTGGAAPVTSMAARGVEAVRQEATVGGEKSGTVSNKSGNVVDKIMQDKVINERASQGGKMGDDKEKQFQNQNRTRM